MSDKTSKSLAQREAGRTFQRASKSIGATEYGQAQEAFRKNYERLKTERLVREAAKLDDEQRRGPNGKRQLRETAKEHQG
jgi:hypothetical protein